MKTSENVARTTYNQLSLFAEASPVKTSHQPESAGIEGERSGLWKEYARIVGELRPRYILIENVAALLYATKQCEGKRREAAITTVLRDLAELGYDAEWRVFSAAEFGAPHLRRRIFIVAYTAGPRRQEWATPTGIHPGLDASGEPMADPNSDRRGQRQGEYQPGTRRNTSANTGEIGEELADAASEGCATGGDTGQAKPSGEALIHDAQHSGEVLAHTSSERLQERSWRGCTEAGNATANGYRKGDAQSCMGGIFDGFSYWLDRDNRWPAGPGEEQYEWEPPRVIQGKMKNRMPRLKALGNACLPQIAEYIGRAILAYDIEGVNVSTIR